MKTFSYLGAALMLLMGVGNVQAANVQKVLSTGQVRIHYPATSPASCDVITLGVGTAMSDNDYDNLAAKLNGYGYIVAVMDHQPGSLTKTDANKYRDLALDVKANMVSWLSSVGVNCNGIAHWIMGGHSAGGQAAHNAVSANAGLADAMFNIDPFDISSAGTVSVPTLNWGFDTTTCFVTKENAAKAAYQKSTGQRAFVRVKVTNGFNWCGPSPKLYHCSFTDGSCPACTNCDYPPNSFYVDVAASVNKFITAAFYGTWSKANLNFTSTATKTLFEGADQP